ncbi:hypothetical protein NN561_017140 [Cricetulus griseus]
MPLDPGSQAQGDWNSQSLQQDTPQRHGALQWRLRAGRDSGLRCPAVVRAELAPELIHIRIPSECSNFPARLAVTRAGRAVAASIAPGAARGWRAGARGVPDPAARARQAAAAAAQPG